MLLAQVSNRIVLGEHPHALVAQLLLHKVQRISGLRTWIDYPTTLVRCTILGFPAARTPQPVACREEKPFQPQVLKSTRAIRLLTSQWWTHLQITFCLHCSPAVCFIQKQEAPSKVYTRAPQTSVNEFDTRTGSPASFIRAWIANCGHFFVLDLQLVVDVPALGLPPVSVTAPEPSCSF